MNRSTSGRRKSASVESGSSSATGNLHLSRLLRARIEPPSQRVLVTQREQLLEQLNAGQDRQVTLLKARAGYGKTTLLTQWRQRLLAKGSRVGWLTLEQSDSDPMQFLEGMRAALQIDSAALADFRTLSPPMALELLLEEIDHFRKPVVLILDEADRISGEPVESLVRLLIRSMPEGMRLVISTRQDAAFDLPSLNARGQLLTLGEAELRFTEREARKLLSNSVDEHTAHNLFERTEGWPVALQLARQWLEKGGRGLDEIMRFTGASTALTGYLTEQMFSQLPANQQELLLALSVLDSFNGDTISRVSGRNDGWTVLDEMLSHGLLIVPIDAAGTAFRFHTMFGEFLLSRLAHSGEQQMRRMHRMAADLYVERGRFIDAIHHARRAGDVERTAELLELAGGMRLWLNVDAPASQRLSLLRSTLELIDPLVSARFPRIELAQAFLCMKSGDFTRARALYACASDSSQEFRRDRPEGDDGSLQTDAMLVMANLVACGGDTAPEHLAQDLAALAKDAAVSHPKLSAYARFTLSVMEYQQGCSAAARTALEGAAQMIVRVDSRLGMIYVHMHESQILRVEGQSLAAVRSLRRASELAVQSSAGDTGLDRMMSIFLADALNDAGDSDAYGSAREFNPPLEAWLDNHLAMLDVEARRAFIEGGYPAVRSVIEKARALAVSRDLPALALAIEACEVEYAAIAGKAEQVGQLPSLLALRLRMPWQSWRIRQSIVVALTLHAIAIGKPLSAQDAIESLLREANLPERTAAFISGHSLLAMIHAAAGDQARADMLMQTALQQAHEGGFIRPFLVLGPELKALMRRMLGRIVKTLGEREELAVFATEILNKLSLRPSQRVVFSAREEEVLRLVLEGKSNKFIARALFITENTVKFHLKRIFTKLDVHGRRNVIREHEKRGLLDRAKDRAPDH